MKKWGLTLIISIFIFLIADIIFAILAAERTIFEGMLNVAYPILLIMVPLLFAILIGLKISEIQNKKTILWKMPLTSATTAIILAIIGYVWVIIDQKINGCVELDCLAPIFLLFAAIVYILVIFLISYFMALIFYYTNKFKRKNL